MPHNPNRSPISRIALLELLTAPVRHSDVLLPICASHCRRTQ